MSAGPIRANKFSEGLNVGKPTVTGGVGGGSGKNYILNPSAGSGIEDTSISGAMTHTQATILANPGELPEDSVGTGHKIVGGAINDYVEFNIVNDYIDDGDSVIGSNQFYFEPLAGYVDEEYAMVIYDKTNAVELHSYPIKNQTGFAVNRASLTAGDNIVARVKALVGSSSGGVFSSISIDPESAVLGGSIDTDYEAYNPNDPAAFTSSSSSGFFKQDATEVLVNAFYTLSSAVSGVIIFDAASIVPNGWTIDGSKLITNGAMFGTVKCSDSSSSSSGNDRGGTPFYAGSGTIRVQSFIGDVFDATDPFTWASGDIIGISVRIPIVELANLDSVNLITDPVVKSNSKIKLNGLTTGTIATGRQLVPYDSDSLEFSDGLTTESSVVTVDAAGVYDIYAVLQASATLTDNCNMFIQKNGSTDLAFAQFVSGNERNSHIQGKFSLAAGDTIQIERTSNVTAFANADTESYFSVVRVADVSSGDTFGFPIAGSGFAGLVASFVGASQQLESGSYTPDGTAGTNVGLDTDVDTYVTGYTKVGKSVIIGGRVDVDPTATGNTTFFISVPAGLDIGASAMALGGAGRNSNGDVVGFSRSSATLIIGTLTSSAATNASIFFSLHYLMD